MWTEPVVAELLILLSGCSVWRTGSAFHTKPHTMLLKYTCITNHQLCAEPVRSNLYHTLCISNQKLYKHRGPFQHHNWNCDTEKWPIRSMTHTICVSERTTWPSEKMALMMSQGRGTRSVGERPFKWHDTRHTPIFSWSTTERIRESDIQCMPPLTKPQTDWGKTKQNKCTLDAFHIFLLSGTDWMKVLRNHVCYGGKTFFQFNFCQISKNDGMLLWLGASSVCGETAGSVVAGNFWYDSSFAHILCSSFMWLWE